ncbi:magnesium chelatase subunit H [Methylocella silvestris]|uniref:magnesium chelatase n=1 Tax=Methylocella silvestris TaxID=199596 RepID=A0A2J7TDE3_METSI|nr:magnesium chelatase subunit H [Methylocella silvestris]PNG24782.1 magnesium chelatase subunit H [Methylocella silvestris]
MTQKRTTAAEMVPIRVVIITMDAHIASAIDRARQSLKRDLPGLSLDVHAACEWSANENALERARAAIATGDVIIATMLFMEEHFKPILPALQARRAECDAMVCAMSAGEVTRLTRMGGFSMDGSRKGPLAMLKRLRGKSEGATAGARQMRMLRRLPKILRFIPGAAQDVRAYFLTLQYWLAGSEDNMANMVRFLVSRYADGARRSLRGARQIENPKDYPEVGVYHPRMKNRVSEKFEDLPRGCDAQPTIGLLVMRSYVLAGNTGHYDGVIAAFEARGLRVIPAFATGLDARPAIERYFLGPGAPRIDVLVSLMGFSLVGGPAYNDSRAAEEILARLDVPYIAAHPLEFQTIEQWRASDRGLSPVEATIMVAIPELDGAICPTVFGGRSEGAGHACEGCARRCVFPQSEGARDMHVCVERAEILAARALRLAQLRRTTRAQRRVAVVLFNFPPNAGNIGTAAFLAVFESLHNTLLAMQRAGYSVEPPPTVDALREAIVHGNASRFGAVANVHRLISVDDHIDNEPWLAEIEAQWGRAPGRQQSDGCSIFVLGAQFGNVFVGIQPAFGYEGDPMRLLFEKGFAPTHAFSAFYRWVRQDFGANAIVHFGTHGALEFMPGKQTGLTDACWPERLLGDAPNLYVYAANNPSEGTLARRRSGATLLSYLTPAIAYAGLYRNLIDLKASIERWRQTPAGAADERAELAKLIELQAAEVDLAPSAGGPEQRIMKLAEAVLEIEYALIPHGLHVIGKAPSREERAGTLAAMAEAALGVRLVPAVIEALIDGASAHEASAAAALAPDEATLAMLAELAKADSLMTEDHETAAILAALDGKFIRPAPGGDLLRTPAILPTGRNLHGFDPFRIPSRFAMQDGARQAARLLERHAAEGKSAPELVALVLWGADNLKTEGSPIGQALWLMGAAPRFDSYGRLVGASLTPLAELDHPRIDVMISMSGIFRDLMPLQIKLLAEAAYLAASADEPLERNFVRKHAVAYQQASGVDLETAALRVFGNADGAYGSNVNLLVDSGRWSDEDEIAETYTRRKGFAYGRSGAPRQQLDLLTNVLAGVDLAYQNLESVELGVTTVDTYFDTLGGVSRAIKRAKGADAETAPVYIGDATRGEAVVRTLEEQVALETRTRILNPKWREGMLQHGFEGVRNIEAHVANTMGWSATTGQVAPWVYHRMTETYLLDPEMRERMAKLNPAASLKIAHRLIEAQERNYWSPDEETLAALRRSGEELEDRLEGIGLDKVA